MTELRQRSSTTEVTATRRSIVKGTGAAAIGSMGMAQPVGAVTAMQTAEPGSSVPLDNESERIGSITMNGVTYELYRQENALWYADGVELYTEEKEVTSRSEANAVLQAFAWQDELSDVNEDTLEMMQETVDTAQLIQDRTGPIVDALQEMVNLFNWMKDTSAVGISVWDAATTASPTLETLEGLVLELRDRIGEWEQTASGITSSLPDLISDIQRARNGDEINYEALRERSLAGSDALLDLEPLTRDLADDFFNTEDASNEVAENMTEVPIYGNDLSNSFRNFGSYFRNLANEISQFADAIAGQASQIETLVTNSDNTHDRLLNQWENRQDADTKVYGTLGGAGTVGFAGIGFALWKFLL